MSQNSLRYSASTGDLLRTLRTEAAMVHSFLKMAVRSIAKAKGHAFINVFGMAVAYHVLRAASTNPVRALRYE